MELHVVKIKALIYKHLGLYSKLQKFIKAIVIHIGQTKVKNRAIYLRFCMMKTQLLHQNNIYLFLRDTKKKYVINKYANTKNSITKSQKLFVIYN